MCAHAVWAHVHSALHALAWEQVWDQRCLGSGRWGGVGEGQEVLGSGPVCGVGSVASESAEVFRAYADLPPKDAGWEEASLGRVSWGCPSESWYAQA